MIMIGQIRPEEAEYYRSAAQSVGAIYSGNRPLAEIPIDLAKGCLRELETAFVFAGSAGSLSNLDGFTPDQARRAIAHNLDAQRALELGTTVLGPMIEFSDDGMRVVPGAVVGIWKLRPEYETANL